VHANNLVVARYLDGRVRKGASTDFTPWSPTFHLVREETGTVEEIRLQDLKAVFFVRSLAGDPTHVALNGFVSCPDETAQGLKVTVLFSDGELLCGYAQPWAPERDGFFLFPYDVDGNNRCVFVRTAATTEIQVGAAAETLAERVVGTGRGV
jgi:hypothetical protein